MLWHRGSPVLAIAIGLMQQYMTHKSNDRPVYVSFWDDW